MAARQLLVLTTLIQISGHHHHSDGHGLGVSVASCPPESGWAEWSTSAGLQ